MVASGIAERTFGNASELSFLSLNHDLLTIINIYTGLGGLVLKAAAVEGEPRIRIRVIRVIRGRNNSRGLVVAEVDVERGEAAGRR